MELGKPKEITLLSAKVVSMEAKLKHLDYIQAVIGRMATNSFLFKGWAISIASLLAGFAVVKTKYALFSIALISTLMFWALDGYYLKLERSFIELYSVVAAKDEADIDFSMCIDRSKSFSKWIKACRRLHLVAFYGSFIIIDVLATYFTRGK